MDDRLCVSARSGDGLRSPGRLDREDRFTILLAAN
jgi:hypothetical protein